jgi:uncharacterized membrane protein YfcA
MRSGQRLRDVLGILFDNAPDHTRCAFRTGSRSRQVTPTNLAVGGAVALAAFVQSTTGFGFALLAAPALVALLAPNAGVSAVAVLGLIVNSLTLLADRQALSVLRGELLRLLAWAVPGLPIGAIVIAWVPAGTLRLAVALLVVGALTQRRDRPRRSGAILPASLAGLTAGVLTTATGLNGPPLVLRLSAIKSSPRSRRHTLAAAFLVLGAFGTGTLTIGGELTLPAATPVFALVSAVGSFAGARAAGRLAPRVDQKLVTGLLIIAAVTAVVSAVS